MRYNFILFLIITKFRAENQSEFAAINLPIWSPTYTLCISAFFACLVRLAISLIWCYGGYGDPCLLRSSNIYCKCDPNAEYAHIRCLSCQIEYSLSFTMLVTSAKKQQYRYHTIARTTHAPTLEHLNGGFRVFSITFSHSMVCSTACSSFSRFGTSKLRILTYNCWNCPILSSTSYAANRKNGEKLWIWFIISTNSNLNLSCFLI